MEIAEYLPYYIGQKARVKFEGLKPNTWVITTSLLSVLNDPMVQDTQVVPILRPLATMTEDECFAAVSHNTRYRVLPEMVSNRFVSYRLQYPARRSKIIHDYFPITPKTPAAFHYLLQRGFDLFGLIDAGLARDVNKSLIKNK